MKKTILFISASLLLVANVCWGKSFDKICDKYKNNLDFTVLNINHLGGLLSSGNNIQCPQEYKAMLESIKNCRVLISGSFGKEFDEDLKKFVKSEKFDELLCVKEDMNKVDIYVQEDNDIVKQILINLRSEKQSIVIRVLGHFDLGEISKLMEEMVKSKFKSAFTTE